jgi:cytidylate kinase
LIVAIDGPAGAGKSTAAKKLAGRLGLRFMDTGAMYRAFTLRAMRLGVDMKDPKALGKVVEDGKLEMPLAPDGSQRVVLDGEDVTDAIRTPEVTRLIYLVAEEPLVRTRLVLRQRALAQTMGGNVVGEGRDLGTVVFPDAQVKIYLDASVEVRTKRRQADLGAGAPPFEKLKAEIEERDQRDASRAVAPLKKAAEAIVVDTSNLSLDQVVETLERIVRERAGRDPTAMQKKRGPK